MGYAVHSYGKGKLEGDPSHTRDDEYVLFNEYIADSFDELPTKGVKLGDRAMFVEGTTMGIAMLVSQGWTSNDGRIKPVKWTDDENSNVVTEELLADLGEVEFTYYESYPGPGYTATISAPDLTLECGKLYNFRIGDMTYRTSIEETEGSSDDRSENKIFFMLEDGTLTLLAISPNDISGTHKVTVSVLSEELTYRILVSNNVIHVASNEVFDGPMSLTVTDEDGNSCNLGSPYGNQTVTSGYIIGCLFRDNNSSDFYDTISSGKKITITCKSVDQSNNNQIHEKVYECATPDFEYKHSNGTSFYGFGDDFVDYMTASMLVDA